VQRLFFALWPTQALRAAIHAATSQMRVSSGARRVPLDNLHITLAFLGAVPAERVTAIRSLASRPYGSSFELTLDHLQTFRRSGVVSLVASKAPSDLLALAATLRRALREMGCQVEDRPFIPHLTLARRVTEVSTTGVTPLVWNVQSFVLVESRLTPSGAHYQIIDQWRLPSC
jgi:2'-5' RNA ligase